MFSAYVANKRLQYCAVFSLPTMSDSTSSNKSAALCWTFTSIVNSNSLHVVYYWSGCHAVVDVNRNMAWSAMVKLSRKNSRTAQ